MHVEDIDMHVHAACLCSPESWDSSLQNSSSPARNTELLEQWLTDTLKTCREGGRWEGRGDNFSGQYIIVVLLFCAYVVV